MRPTDAEIIRRALESRLADLWTAIPGKVVKYDSTTRTADVLPVVRRPIATSEDELKHEDLPIIPNVPVLFPSGGGASITWPIVPGDFVQLLIQTLSPQQWRQSGETSDPGDLRLHSLGNAVCVPGLMHNAQALPGAALPAIVLEHTDIRLGVGATDFVALSSKVEAELTRIKEAIAAGIPTANDGGANLQSTILAALDLPDTFPASTAATKVKAE